MTDPDNTSVRFSGKDLFLQIQTRLDGISSKLDTKADIDTVRAIEHRVSGLGEKVTLLMTERLDPEHKADRDRRLEGRLAQVERSQSSGQGATDFKRWLVPILVSVGLLVFNTVVNLIQAANQGIPPQ